VGPIYNVSKLKVNECEEENWNRATGKKFSVSEKFM
jgi:hypothetical protein